mgnify:CR=1 FL=1
MLFAVALFKLIKVLGDGAGLIGWSCGGCGPAQVAGMGVIGACNAGVICQALQHPRQVDQFIGDDVGDAIFALKFARHAKDGGGHNLAAELFHPQG